jgi:hypothetical protein
MAISRVNPSARFKVISELDDALERETPEELEALKQPDGTSLPTRYEQYAENLDESKLRFREGAKPDRFVIRCLRNEEVAEIQAKHLVVDTTAKTTKLGNPALAFLDYFKVGCVGLETAEGNTVKLGSDDVGFAVAVGVGSVIMLFTSLGKHLKK